MKIIHKLIMGFMGIAILAGMIGYVSWFHLNRIKESSYKNIPESLVEIRETSKLNEFAQLMGYYDEVLTQSARNYAFTEDSRWKERYQSIEPELDIVIKEAIERGDQKDKEFFSAVDEANILLVAMENQAIGFVDFELPVEAIKILESNDYWDQKAQYSKGLKDYISRRGDSYSAALLRSTETVDRALSETQELIKVSTRTVLLFSLVALVLGIIVSIVVSRSISLPIIRLQDAAEDLGKGKFTGELKIKSGGEIGFLVDTFNRMVNDLKLQRDSIIDNMLESLIVVDAQGKIKRANDSILNLLDYKEDELIGQSVFKIFDVLFAKSIFLDT